MFPGQSDETGALTGLQAPPLLTGGAHPQSREAASPRVSRLPATRGRRVGAAPGGSSGLVCLWLPQEREPVPGPAVPMFSHPRPGESLSYPLSFSWRSVPHLRGHL